MMITKTSTTKMAAKMSLMKVAKTLAKERVPMKACLTTTRITIRTMMTSSETQEPMKTHPTMAWTTTRTTMMSIGTYPNLKRETCRLAISRIWIPNMAQGVGSTN